MAQTNTVKMLTINEAAQLVPGLTKYRIREMCISGEIPCVKAGRKYLICEQVLIRYLTEPPMPQSPAPDTRKLHRIDS